MAGEGRPAVASLALEVSCACPAKEEGRSHRMLEEPLCGIIVSFLRFVSSCFEGLRVESVAIGNGVIAGRAGGAGVPPQLWHRSSILPSIAREEKAYPLSSFKRLSFTIRLYSASFLFYTG